MAELRFITVGDGAQCVMMAGISRMLTWSVESWASPEHPVLLFKQSTVRGLALSGWMTSVVKETRYRLENVPMTQIHLTVITATMQVLSVK